jgi:hypothetical protein
MEKDISFTPAEWKRFCSIMRSLTWGKEIYSEWSALKNSVESRIVKGTQDDNSSD